MSNQMTPFRTHGTTVLQRVAFAFDGTALDAFLASGVTEGLGSETALVDNHRMAISAHAFATPVLVFSSAVTG